MKMIAKTKRVGGSLMIVVPFTGELARTAASFYTVIREKNSKFSMAGAIVLAAARSINAKVLTKDSDFRKIPEAVLLK